MRLVSDSRHHTCLPVCLHMSANHALHCLCLCFDGVEGTGTLMTDRQSLRLTNFDSWQTGLTEGALSVCTYIRACRSFSWCKSTLYSFEPSMQTLTAWWFHRVGLVLLLFHPPPDDHHHHHPSQVQHLSFFVILLLRAHSRAITHQGRHSRRHCRRSS